MTGGMFAILDDIAVLLDDVAIATKVSMQKTVGILGDDLAVNAQKSAGFVSSRELPVLYAITKGSLINKTLILPVAFLLSAYASYMIVPILLVGGVYLCFEGAEKIHEYIKQKISKNTQKQKIKKLSEKQKINSAILTDFVLSIEIVMLTLGSVLEYSLFTQIVATSIVAFVATIGVYGLVALIVRMDDVGLFIVTHSTTNSYKQKFGRFLISSLPKTIKALTVIGTVAMFLVGGGIFSHNIEMIHHIGIFLGLYSMLFDLFLGAVVGVVAVLVFQLKHVFV
jgi:predicted DNA repair protein MutK